MSEKCFRCNAHHGPLRRCEVVGHQWTEPVAGQQESLPDGYTVIAVPASEVEVWRQVGRTFMAYETIHHLAEVAPPAGPLALTTEAELDAYAAGREFGHKVGYRKALAEIRRLAASDQRDTTDRRWVNFDITVGPFPEPVAWESAEIDRLNNELADLVMGSPWPDGCDGYVSGQLGRPDWADSDPVAEGEQ